MICDVVCCYCVKDLVAVMVTVFVYYISRLKSIASVTTDGLLTVILKSIN